MNTHEIFKGLLFLQGDVNRADFADRHQRPRYGAASLRERIAPPLGNRSASRAWFGRAPEAAPAPAGCVAGGCG